MSAINLDKGVLEYLKGKYPNLKEEFFYDPRVKLAIGHFVSNIPERNNFLLKDTIVYIEQNAPRSGKTTTVIAGIKTYPEYPYFRAIPYPYNSIGKEVKLYDVNNVIEAFENIFKNIVEYLPRYQLKGGVSYLLDVDKNNVMLAHVQRNDDDEIVDAIADTVQSRKFKIIGRASIAVYTKIMEIAKFKIGNIVITPKQYLLANYLQQYLAIYFEHIVNAKR